MITAISRHLLRMREDSGCLDLSRGGGSELKFTLDAEGLPVQATEKEEMEVHSSIAELMILANSSVWYDFVSIFVHIQLTHSVVHLMTYSHAEVGILSAPHIYLQYTSC